MSPFTGQAAGARLPEPVLRAEVRLETAEATQAWAGRLARLLRGGDVLILTGELGAGKTTFTQGLGAGLQVREGIISPTFVLSRIHPSVRAAQDPRAVDLVHVDAYRLGSAGELLDLDLDATVDRSVTVVEWGRGMAEALAGWPEDPEASWLDIELVRAVGAAPGAVPAEGEGASSGIITDFSEDEDGTDEIRSAVLTAYGPRWAGVELPRT
ncbi:tRNA (adenosine(37)-N6)-threonylcarbamoyltransferase complex ATPase subunit type 1 TsaE [Micrococcus terreus]|uniref:tRNA (adenosine(37)-N6)-threonylcarbamoyltransferase complex ATPase subunit type 1 TsaE n=1 Tax=Micrococcus terreus TaxID=574650 RepID=UPI00254A3A80|nr:tRNA (adenosine(37)-N6)-threonylcarbamoyltransferase complex ATPase subunit type 1 TsaE [Micrococcus terreus]MDK7702281.1 tRNA (adenosine(37)-N6)-threonylcarbamoyltransferase complex ATPase subunit type 1 TsaE [Micrococcus terreus]WOO98847.1 tRNA (adenosine(37)-N6)-threonylcarbamoyltransferase complex ATPase subunit type 1 TsaE [Micrococcus terreus]